MQNKVSRSLSSRLNLVVLGVSSLLLVAGATLPGLRTVVLADQYDEQIKALQQQNNANQSVLGGLQATAASYQDAISRLQAQIDGVQASINANIAKQADLQAQIVAAQQEIARQKSILSTDIKSMYVDGTPSTIEILATSRNLSEFVDKQEYRTTVQNKLQETLKKIAELQLQLQAQKVEVDQLLKDQQAQQAQLASDRAQQASMLSYNEGQQAAYNQQISANASQINSLRQAQIAANARFIGSAGTGPACGGGYPARWCNIGQDTALDNWGMYNRECVSYTAFRVAASGRFMPGWGFQGRGNANQWVDDARSDGIPVDTTPHAGDVAISLGGAYGHAMYVESVNGDGTINISQYNAALDGRFSNRYNLNPSGLYFIHF
jgi:surface antigen